MNGTIYIYFEGFEIGIGLHYLTDENEHVENDVKGKGIPFPLKKR